VRCGAVEGSSRRVPTRSCFLRQAQDKRISEERTVEVQADIPVQPEREAVEKSKYRLIPVHPERGAVEGRQAQDERISEERRVEIQTG